MPILLSANVDVGVVGIGVGVLDVLANLGERLGDGCESDDVRREVSVEVFGKCLGERLGELISLDELGDRFCSFVSAFFGLTWLCCCRVEVGTGGNRNSYL